ncbi:chaperonin 10-like protein [Stachybotrys elegans]|uniref:Chaperonin 10-like protein n=1 Tax=Stachybotrys elegans TaxID=80388 RepID=A0A8K0SG44_9HYPO|nr:chaperonin 10-like protein [Stachybotrys elegans]
MSLINAVIVQHDRTVSIQKVPLPKLHDEWILVQVKAVALNPTDWKKVVMGWTDTGSRLGVDYSGVVEDVGSKVTRFRKGDRVAGLVNGGDTLNHDNGAFATYIIAKECVQIHIPDNLSFEQAATVGLGVVTCGQGLYRALQLPLPDSGSKLPIPVLIHGASTSTGILGIQLAKVSGLFVIATASPHNFQYLESLGADAVFDYHSPTAGSEIRALTENKLKHAWDCAGNGEVICANALSDCEPSRYAGINLSDDGAVLQRINSMVEGPILTAGYDVFGENWAFGDILVPAKPDEMAFASRFLAIAQSMLAEGTLLPVNATVKKFENGLEGVIKGLDELRRGKLSATKLVYTF